MKWDIDGVRSAEFGVRNSEFGITQNYFAYPFRTPPSEEFVKKFTYGLASPFSAP
jgi:hypothetical protein